MPLTSPVPAGLLRLPVVGVIRDYSNQLGSFYLDRAVSCRYFQDDTVNIFRVYVKPGVSAEEVRQRINRTLGRRGVCSSCSTAK